jgi:hypothetical protein
MKAIERVRENGQHARQCGKEQVCGDIVGHERPVQDDIAHDGHDDAHAESCSENKPKAQNIPERARDVSGRAQKFKNEYWQEPEQQQNLSGAQRAIAGPQLRFEGEQHRKGDQCVPKRYEPAGRHQDERRPLRARPPSRLPLAGRPAATPSGI